jgi:hypothetical protein
VSLSTNITAVDIARSDTSKAVRGIHGLWLMLVFDPDQLLLTTSASCKRPPHLPTCKVDRRCCNPNPDMAWLQGWDLVLIVDPAVSTPSQKNQLA